MPYVDPQTRDRLSASSGLPARQRQAMTAGQLTYQLQQVLLAFIKYRGLKYQTLAECLGALEGAKLDLAERVIKPLEEQKREANGDVWPDSLTGMDANKVSLADYPPLTYAGGSVHTCSAECPCQTGGKPKPDFLPRPEYGGWD